MDGGEKNIYQTLSFEIWMEERKTYTKHCHWRYGWRRETIYQTFSFEIWMEERKTYTKHCHLRYGWRKEKHIPNIFI
jgi:uncharacterized C2H2 Zn-finger protein